MFVIRLYRWKKSRVSLNLCNNKFNVDLVIDK